MVRFNDNFMSLIDEWKAGGPPRYVCAVDIGGTNTRVAFSLKGSSDYVVGAKFTSSAVCDWIRNINQVAAQANELLGTPALSACIDAAGPISKQGQEVTLTNWSGENRTLRIADLDTRLFPLGKTHFINDLESASYGLLALSGNGKMSDYFKHLWGPDPQEPVELRNQHYVVMAMGTGLGVSSLLSFNGEPHKVLPMEGGHLQIVSLCASSPNSAKDASLLKFISEKCYDGEHTCEYEDICSGRGLQACYDWVTETSAPENNPHDDPDAAKIAELASREDPHAVEAMTLHYVFLARAATQLCVAIQAKGVIFAGDNQVDNDWFVSKHADAMEAALLNHPKREWLSAVRVFTQCKSTNINLQGCVYFAEHHCE